MIINITDYAKCYLCDRSAKRATDLVEVKLKDGTTKLRCRDGAWCNYHRGLQGKLRLDDEFPA